MGSTKVRKLLKEIQKNSGSPKTHNFFQLWPIVWVGSCASAGASTSGAVQRNWPCPYAKSPALFSCNCCHPPVFFFSVYHLFAALPVFLPPASFLCFLFIGCLLFCLSSCRNWPCPSAKTPVLFSCNWQKKTACLFSLFSVYGLFSVLPVFLLLAFFLCCLIVVFFLLFCW